MIEGALSRMSLMKRITEVSLSLRAVFGEIGAGEHAERRADADADHGHDERADDGIEQAASVDPGGGVFSVNTLS